MVFLRMKPALKSVGVSLTVTEALSGGDIASSLMSCSFFYEAAESAPLSLSAASSAYAWEWS